MRRNNPLVLLVIGLMFCSILTLQAGVIPARATSVNLADEAVSYLSNQYLANGTSSSGLGSYDVYILRSAGVNVGAWVYNGESVPAAVTSLTQQDLQSSNANGKELAQDLAAMQALGQDTGKLLQRLQSEQSAGGFDQGAYSAFTNMPAYDLLGRTGNLSTFNYVYAKTYLLGRQNADGSWDQSWTDFITTAESVRALKYLDLIQSDSTIETAITSGCNWLKQQQQSDGSFNPSGSYDDSLIDTVEAIATQKGLGLDPATWITNGKSGVDYLEAVVPNSNGSFGTSGDVLDATWLLDGCNQLGISLTGRPLVPAISLNGGSISTSQTVGINATLFVNQAVCYTITSGSTGTMPTVTSSVYSTPFIVSTSAGTFTVESAVYDSAAGLWSIPAVATFTVTSNSGGGGGAATISVGVAIVGQNGQTMYGPSSVTVSPGNQWGLTVLGALDATGTHYATTSTDVGVWVANIDGEAMQQGGTAGWIFTVNGVESPVGPAVTNINNGDRVLWYWSSSMSQAPPTWPSGTTPGGGSPGVTSTTGSASVDPATGGTVSLGSSASVNIPAGALNGTASVTVAIQQVSSPPAVPAGFSLLGSVYEFTVGGSTGYSFAEPVTLTFTFDPTAVPAGETPAIYYYDESSEQWVSLGGAVSGSTITVTVNHFTKFAVLAGKAATPAGPATAPATAARFTDVPASLWAYGDIESLSGLGYISGYPDGSFKPGNAITRAEFVSILGKALKLAAYNPAAPDFSDVAQGDWCYGSVEDAVYAGIVKGCGGAFKPDDPITREEMAVILVKALNEQAQAGSGLNSGTSFTDNARISTWAKGFVAVAVQDGLIKGYPGDNSFRPESAATRAEACAMIVNFLNIRK
jgi:plastocyanin